MDLRLRNDPALQPPMSTTSWDLKVLVSKAVEVVLATRAGLREEAIRATEAHDEGVSAEPDAERPVAVYVDLLELEHGDSRSDEEYQPQALL